MSKRKIGGVMASAFIAGALVCGSIFASGNQVMTGGSKQGKSLWTDYCGMSKEVQGPVDAILFTQSPRTAKGDPYQNYPHYVPEGSRVVSYGLDTVYTVTEDGEGRSLSELSSLCPGGQQGCIVRFKDEGIEGVDQ